MLGWFGGPGAQLMSLQGAAGVVETFGGLLIMLGLFTRVAAFLSSGEMAVAFWYIHVSVIAMGGQGAGLPIGLLPIMNGGVDAALFCFAFLFIAARGPGIWSVDAAMGRK
jgi:putative oxidoreductase